MPTHRNYHNPVTPELVEWHRIIREEFYAPLFMSDEKEADIRKRYADGIFSPGRPGVISETNESEKK